MYAIGWSRYIEEEYGEAISIIEKAISSLQPEKLPQGMAEAYFRLGWLYQESLADSDQAIANYDQAIKFFARATATGVLERRGVSRGTHYVLPEAKPQ